MWIDDLQAIYNPSNVSVQTIAQNDFNVYAFERNLFVDLKDKNDAAAKISVIDLAGKVVFTQTLNANEMNEIAMPSSVVNGTYLYEISGSEVQKTGKFVIR